ncbi:hypothetical protein HPB48_009452 [Haemaphysalis longicornis]|uniref:Uncharacterized protein n=1 Tax=Haemaphysalis longicornis TaxID=44386 RepID=A0A9J6GF37_HAELO|nr:hypothetical protein HPB48_009452 [Haemaphysalis longicornis]
MFCNSVQFSAEDFVALLVFVSACMRACVPVYLGRQLLECGPITAGTSDAHAPNRIQITVLIPHRDGLLPAISTRPLSNLEFALSPSSLRVGLHRCSNLVDASEAFTRFGFLTNDTADTRRPPEGSEEPYQFSRKMRSPETLRWSPAPAGLFLFS